MFTFQSINLNLLTVPQEDITNQIIMSLSIPSLTPLERYAIASQLAKAATEAAKQLSNDGIEFALDGNNGCQPLAGEGKQFAHNGKIYQIQFVNDYNYNQGDEHGKQWCNIVSQIDELESRKKALTKNKKGIEAIILDEHPRLQPVSTTICLKYITSKA